MKNKFISLYKTILLNNYSTRRGKSTKAISGIITSIIIYICLFIFSLLYSLIGIVALKENNMQNYFPLIVYIITILMTFMLTINKSKSTIFDSKYNDLLFAMPIKPKTILLSRIMTLLTMNYITTLVIMVPALLIFGIFFKMSVTYYIFALLSVLFTPFLPVTLASVIGYIIAFLTSRVKVATKVFETIFTFLFFGIFIICYSFAGKIFDLALANFEKIDIFINKYGFILKYITNTLSYCDFLSMLKFVGVNLLLLIILVWALSIGFLKTSQKLAENTTSKKMIKNISYTKNKVLKTLTLKELKNMFSIPTYIFNSLFGVVILLFAAIASFFISKDQIFGMINIGQIDMNSYISIMILSAALFIVGMSNTTCSSISLEGNKFWIIKSLPINFKKVLDSKILTNMITVSVPTTFSLLIICINFKINIIETLFIILISVVLNVIVSQFGLLINLAFPKLDFETEIQVIKQSTSSFISVFSMMIFAVIVIMGVFVLSFTIGINIAMIIILAVFLIIAFCERLIINSYGVKKLEKMSN